jgi:hypothetical protein
MDMTNSEMCTIAQYIDWFPVGWSFQNILDDLEGEHEYVYVADLYQHIDSKELAMLMKHTDLTIGGIFGEYKE